MFIKNIDNLWLAQNFDSQRFFNEYINKTYDNFYSRLYDCREPLSYDEKWDNYVNKLLNKKSNNLINKERYLLSYLFSKRINNYSYKYKSYYLNFINIRNSFINDNDNYVITSDNIKMLLKNSMYSTLYSMFILNKRWKYAEYKIIYKDIQYAKLYILYFFNNKFPDDEIYTNPLYNIWYDYMSKKIFNNIKEY